MNKLLLYIFLFTCTASSFSQPITDSVQPTETVYPVYTDSVYYSKREFTPGFKEKYNDTDFVYENKAKVTSLWERFKTWLGNLLNDIFSFGDNTQRTPWFAVVVRLLAGLIILFVVYLIVKALLNKEGMWIFAKSGKKINIQELTEEDIKTTDFGKLVEETKANGNYRLGIRYYYLWLLKKLALREIIDWHWDKTNTDYLYEIKDSSLRKDFEYLSYVYDHSWYGEFEIDESAFAKAEKAFRKTINSI
ncbi:DUF4129 domain-containing protein [Flavobacterium sp. MK4S-17]|uniref:DUF4129 domain-containing protein n=1 Tax=Flavobacterium sp. MK4S-17 TaxID=2543737 RepID=UPI00135C39DF|nr:DUF4129 domain-containing protein [Flavobacterium sp. MK4S-17]